MKFVDLNNLRENLENFYLKIISPKIKALNDNKIEEGDIAKVAFTGLYEDLENAPNVDLTPYAKLRDVYTKDEIDASNTFTSTSATTIKVGGIEVGSTFKNATLAELMQKMLYGTVATPEPKFVGTPVASATSNTISIGLETSSGFKTTVVDTSKIRISEGTITTAYVSGDNLIVKTEGMKTGTITFEAGSLKNTPTSSSVYTGTVYNKEIVLNFTVTRSTLPTPSFTATFINSTKTINIKIPTTFNAEYATLSELTSASISGVSGTLAGSGKNYTFTIDDSVEPGLYTFKIADGAVTLSAEEGYYNAASNSSEEYTLQINIEGESDDESYEWIESFTMEHTDNYYFHSETLKNEVDEIGVDEAYELFDSGKYELYFLGTSAHPCEILIPAADTDQVIGDIPESCAHMVRENAYWDFDAEAAKQIALNGFSMTTGVYEFALKKAK